MPERPHNQVPVRRAAAISGLVHGSRRMLARIDRLTAVPAALDLVPHALHAGEKLHLVVERGHHHMPALPPLRVIAVMVGDEAPYVVVLGVNPRHRPRVIPRRPALSSPEPRRRARPRACRPGVAHQVRPGTWPDLLGFANGRWRKFHLMRYTASIGTPARAWGLEEWRGHGREPVVAPERRRS